jgi:protein-S-isoprenylcysteine O-methyltransferase Ste14
MTDATRLLIGFCWVAWLLYWLVMATATKRTVERGGLIAYRMVAIVIVVGYVAVTRLLDVSANAQLWQTALALGFVSLCLVLAGAAFTVWARITLGRNWSVEVTFKQEHELIESGPYALARHPIYTGLIVMALGTAIDLGRAFGFVVLVALCCMFWLKAREEECMMDTHFPDAYAEYKARVHAIVPFVL